MYRTNSTPPSTAAYAASNQAGPVSGNTGGTPGGGAHPVTMTLLALVVAYIVWWVVSTHEKVTSAVAPKNIAFSAWNFLFISFTVVISINVGRILWTKLASIGFPGAEYLANIWYNA